MKFYKKFFQVFLMLFLIYGLCGCATTVDQMYSIPRRSEGYRNLQTVMESAMKGLEYAAPLTGDNQQPVQMEDLDGDDVEEAIVFAKSQEGASLRILIFSCQEDRYYLSHTIESSGFAFEKVEYAGIDGVQGKELVVGSQVHNQMMRNLCVYNCASQESRQLLSVSYGKYLLADMDRDNRKDVVILTQGETKDRSGLIQVYMMDEDQICQSNSAELSYPFSEISYLLEGTVSEDTCGVFAVGDQGENGSVADVFVLDHGALVNIALRDGKGIAMGILGDFYLYPEDIDHDGIIEIPEIISLSTDSPDLGEKAIRWYCMNVHGRKQSKMYTYHDFLHRWYTELDPDLIPLLNIQEENENVFLFSVWNREIQDREDLWRLYILTGQERSAEGDQGQRFIIKKTDSVVYAVELEDAARLAGVNQDMLAQRFHLIRRAWNTGIR